MEDTRWDPLRGRLDIETLRGLYETRKLSPVDVVRGIYRRIAEGRVEAVWIHLRPEAEAASAAESLEGRRAARFPLFGIPFAVKDNIDVAGMPTTAACPDFSYLPATSATAVSRLERAGAICIGKTNLDQFATGLSGVRSPYGACRCVFDNRYIAGGSSSGSAVGVAAGLVSFSLGTDTGGSGRVPAGCNNVVGLKPTRGIVPTTGLVPNCRTLDCVSVFALTCDDALAVLDQIRGADRTSPFERRGIEEADLGRYMGARLRIGVPRGDQRQFFGDPHAEERYANALGHLHQIGHTVLDIDFAPFSEAGQLMFDGPWLAERLQALGPFIAEHPNAVLPVTREIIFSAGRFSAADAFGAYYRLRELKRQVLSIFADIDVLALPTTATIHTVADVEADPVVRNSMLGHYSYFVNLLDLAACAVPNGLRPDGLPSGVTFVGPALSDRLLAQLGGAYHRHVGGQLGATGHTLRGPASPVTVFVKQS
jgi:allophanate hydrolase